MASEFAKDLIRRWRSLEGSKSVWASHWEDLATVFHPRRAGFVTSPIEGDKRTDNLYDGVPMQAARGLANSIGGLLRPDGQPWFFIKPADDGIERSDEVAEWLAKSQDRLLTELLDPRTRFRQATGEVDLDLVVFGTGVLFAGEHPNLGTLLHQSIHLKDATVVFGETGDPEGIFIARKMTLRNAVNKFGKEKLSEDTRKKIDEPNAKMDEKIEVLHAVVPRKEGKKNAMLAKNLPFADIWIEVEAAHEIAVAGYHEFPFIVPRFDTTSGEDYGRSPGMIALPDANSLQAMGRTILTAGQRAADPPLAVPFDSMIDAPNMFPGGLAYYDVDLAKELGSIPIQPIESGHNLAINRDIQNDVRQQVWSAFFRNVLNLPRQDHRMTATEVIQLKEEMLREIGPVFGRLETDYTAPVIERDFRVMLRAGAFDPIPEALQGRSIRFEYESPVKRIRQQVEAAAAQLWATEVAQLAQVTGRPDVFDIVDVDALVRFGHEAKSLPHTLIRGAEEVAAIRQQRAEAEQAQAELASMQQIAEVADTGASAIKQLQQEAA